MTNIKIEIENILKIINARISDIKPILPILMSMVEMKIDENFAKQGRWNGNTSNINILSGGNRRWTPLSRKTLENYAKSKDKRPNATILNRHGGRGLLGSIGYRINNNSAIAITVGKPYAAIHQFGGRISHPGGTPYIVTKDKGVLFISKKKADQLKKKNKQVFYTKKHTIVIPPRPYIVLSENDIAEIIDRLEKYILN
jgi:phage gpG-like protein